MKTWKKVVYGSSLVCLISGIALGTYGYQTGGMDHVAQAKIEKSNLKEKSKTFESVKQIDISANISSVKIIETNDAKPSILYYTDKKVPVEVSNNGGTLVVKETSKLKHIKGKFNFINLKDIANFTGKFTIGMDSPYHITVKIPKGTDVKSLKTTIALGELYLENITSQQSDLSLNLGELTLSNCKLTNGNVDLKIGSINVNNCQLTDLTVKQQTGDASISESQMDNTTFKLQIGDFNGSSLTYLNTNSLITQAGDVHIKLAKYDLTVNPKKSIGDTQLTTILKKSSNNRLDINTQAGDLEVQ
ncbi:DUF4097 family beta strand repeat-containing protein [Streptococcus hongkongensis]